MCKKTVCITIFILFVLLSLFLPGRYYGLFTETAFGEANYDIVSMGFQQDMLKAINDARARGATSSDGVWHPPVPPLTWNDRLEAAALRHSTDMYRNSFMSHTGSDGSSPWERIADAGYGSSSSASENVAKYYSSIEQVMNAWLSSPGHCANIMSSTVTEVGAARVGNFWTQNFASPLYVPVYYVILDGNDKIVGLGDTLQLTATIIPDYATNKNITWSSGNPDVAVVSENGKVTAINFGETVITVKTECGGIIATANIIVRYVPPEYVALDKNNLELYTLGVRSKKRLNAVIYPHDTSYKEVKWDSDDPLVASVNTNGVVSASTGGSTVITVETTDGGKTDTCIVEVIDDGIFYGDMNNDRVIDIKDAIMLLRHIVGLNIINENELLRADVTGTGQVNVQDAIAILRYIVGIF